MSLPLFNMPDANLDTGWDDANTAYDQQAELRLPYASDLPAYPPSMVASHIIGDVSSESGVAGTASSHTAEHTVGVSDNVLGGTPGSTASVEFMSSPSVQCIDEPASVSPSFALARSPSVEFTGTGSLPLAVGQRFLGPRHSEQVPSKDWLYRPTECGMVSHYHVSRAIANLRTDAQVDPPRFYHSQDEIDTVHARYRHLLNPEHARRAKERDEAFVLASHKRDAQRAERPAAVAAVPDRTSCSGMRSLHCRTHTCLVFVKFSCPISVTLHGATIIASAKKGAVASKPTQVTKRTNFSISHKTSSWTSFMQVVLSHCSRARRQVHLQCQDWPALPDLVSR
jgi:hypothetical protein